MTKALINLTVSQHGRYLPSLQWEIAQRKSAQLWKLGLNSVKITRKKLNMTRISLKGRMIVNFEGTQNIENIIN